MITHRATSGTNFAPKILGPVLTKSAAYLRATLHFTPSNRSGVGVKSPKQQGNHATAAKCYPATVSGARQIAHRGLTALQTGVTPPRGRARTAPTVHNRPAAPKFGGEPSGRAEFEAECRIEYCKFEKCDEIDEPSRLQLSQGPLRPGIHYLGRRSVCNPRARWTRARRSKQSLLNAALPAAEIASRKRRRQTKCGRSRHTGSFEIESGRCLRDDCRDVINASNATLNQDVTTRDRVRAGRSRDWRRTASATVLLRLSAPAARFCW
jgi:hypothetical protein